MIDITVFKELLKRKKLIFLCWLFSNLILLFYYMSNPELYGSKVSFYIEQSQRITVSEDIENESKEYARSGILHQIKSTEMIDFLIKRFDLYAHFEIEPDSNKNYPQIHEKVKKMIAVSGVPSGEIIVNVKSADNKLAANMANEIFIKLDSSIKNQFVKNFEKKLLIYRKITEATTQKINTENTELGNLVEEFKTVVKGTGSLKSNDALWDINSKLTGILLDIKSDNGKLKSTLENLEMASSILKDRSLINIKLINKALVDTTSPIKRAFYKFAALSGMILLCISFLVVLVKMNFTVE